MVASLNIQAAVLSYIVIMYMPTYLTSIAHIPMPKVMLLNLTLMLTIMFCTPLIGLLSDKLSGKSLLIIASLGTVLFTYPVYHLFLQPNIHFMVIGEIIFGLLTAMGMNAAAKIMTGISSPELRYSCVSVGHGICDSIFGSTAPFMATLLVSMIGVHVAPAYYIIFAGIITLFAAWRLKSEDPAKERILQGEAQPAG
jgi:MHS family proline/betaine transporter-like MFS transporter